MLPCAVIFSPPGSVSPFPTITQYCMWDSFVVSQFVVSVSVSMSAVLSVRDVVGAAEKQIETNDP